MQLARVRGHVWATRKLDSFEGRKLMVLEPVDEQKQPNGTPLVAVDTVDAGIGDLVFYATSREAAIPFPGSMIPVDATIVGVVDRIDR